MSIFGSMTTAVLGLSAQSKALGHISDNIANASTVGYKRVNTAFETLVLQSNERLHAPGGVTAAPVFMNNIQGNLTQVQSPTNAAIQGQGFFSVSKLSRGLTGPGQQGETVQTQTGTLNADNVYYTRVGDFELDKNRYLVNSAGFALNGWIVDDVTGQLKKDVVQPLQVNTLTDKPQSTNSITLGANLPATPTPGVPIPSSSIQVYDTQGNARTIQFNWRQDAANAWRLGIDAPGSSTQPVAGSFAGGAASMATGSQVGGVTPVAQVSQVLVNGTTSVPASSVTVSGRTNYYPDGTSQDNIRFGDTYSLTINGINTVTVGPLDTAGGDNDISNFPNYSDVANALASQINATTPYIAEIDSKDPRRVLVKTVDGTPVEVSSGFSNAAPQLNTISGPSTTMIGANQRSTFTFSNSNGGIIDVGDEFRITVADREFKTRVTSANINDLLNNGGINAVVADLADQITNADPPLNINVTVPAGTPNQLVLDGTITTPTFNAAYGVTNADSRKNDVKGSSPVDYQAATVTTTQDANPCLLYQSYEADEQLAQNQ
ncbi:flagellar hook-basal body complex protein, partial [Azospirillum brasilense]|uniref:flagellar hook-basal body complex protein n=1 Tax=Azospirillum brasilense TaxID=192 RepID=UPI00157AF4E5